jgi:hypothetical protein
MDELNNKVGDTYCQICACDIRDKNKHIATKKHQKMCKEIFMVFNGAKMLKSVFDKFDVNDSTQTDNIINFLTGVM